MDIEICRRCPMAWEYIERVNYMQFEWGGYCAAINRAYSVNFTGRSFSKIRGEFKRHKRKRLCTSDGGAYWKIADGLPVFRKKAMEEISGTEPCKKCERYAEQLMREWNNGH